MPTDVNAILEKLAKDVEAAVHQMYRGEVRQATAKVKTGQLLAAAKSALGAAVHADGSLPAPNASVHAVVTVGGASGWTGAEADAVMRCINAWLPIGAPKTTAPASACIAAGKMLVPSWGERELAREAVRRLP